MRVQILAVIVIILLLVACGCSRDSSDHDAAAEVRKIEQAADNPQPEETAGAPRPYEPSAPAGIRKVITIDWYADGSPDEICYKYYYKTGDQMRDERDYGVDGTIDEVCTYFYDEDTGLLVRFEADKGNDGTLDFTSDYYWTGEERIDRIESDIDTDGVVDAVEYYVYGDMLDTVERIEVDFLGYGFDTDIAQDVFYGPDGSLERIEYVTYPGGALQIVVRYFYDDSGMLIEEEWDYTSEPGIQERRYHSWDKGTDLFLEYHLLRDKGTDLFLEYHLLPGIRGQIYF